MLIQSRDESGCQADTFSTRTQTRMMDRSQGPQGAAGFTPIGIFARSIPSQRVPPRKLHRLARRAFDFNASNPRIWPLDRRRLFIRSRVPATQDVFSRERETNKGEPDEAVLLPSGARLVAIACQRFGRLVAVQHRSDSRW